MHKLFELRSIATNGLNVRVAVEGVGPLVVLVHGWPELWYSWRHQIKAIAEAGYKVIAPDVRGYGGSDKPYAIRAYSMKELMGDLIGLIDAFDEDKATVIGHDWGAPICWNTASHFPERIKAVAGLSVPYRKRQSVPQIELWADLYRDKFFYQNYFQQEGKAEEEFEADVNTALRKIYFSISGDSPSLASWINSPPRQTMLEGLTNPNIFPSWLTSEDLSYFTQNFKASGFRGPINRYRNQVHDYEALPEMGVLPVGQPSCFIAGSNDVVRYFVPGHDAFEGVDSNCTDMRVVEVIDGPGHWVQQEAPERVNELLLSFLSSVYGAANLTGQTVGN